MMRAIVNDVGIVLTLDSPLDNLSREGWDLLLDELRSSPVPGLYQSGKRMSVDVGPDGEHKGVVYFTSQTVTVDEAVPILKTFNIAVKDVRGNSDDQVQSSEQ